MLEDTKCRILTWEKTKEFDSYVLSESSLFVFSNSLVLKTCGTSSPLLAIPRLFSLAEKLDIAPVSLLYCHKNFRFPDQQPFPFRSFEEEAVWLETGNFVFSGGQAETVGDQVFVYTKIFQTSASLNSPSLTADLLMEDFPVAVGRAFFKEDAEEEHEVDRMTRLVTPILDDAVSSVAAVFDPCGFSLNAQFPGNRESARKYLTMHITPEESCAYASTEIGNCSASEVLQALQRSMTFFRPKTCTLIVYHSDLRSFDSLAELFGSAEYRVVSVSRAESRQLSVFTLARFK